MVNQLNNKDLHHVVIVGGGFGGLYAAQKLANAPVKVTLIDKRNFHVFQPLLYQVATGGLSPADISSPLRSLLSKNKNTEVLMGEVMDIDPDQQTVQLRYREIKYDSLILATGVTHQYFGNDWEGKAPGLKTIENALEIRRRVFIAFEAAEKEPNPQRRKDWLTFVLVGAGPAGVELAGALAELAHGTLKEDFRNIDTSQAEIILLQSPDRILPVYPPHLSAKAQKSLEKLGVTVKTGVRVTDIRGQIVTYREGNQLEQIQARTILWTAGMKASPIANILAERTDAQLDKAGRVIVEPHFNLAKYPNIFVIGDLAHYEDQEGNLLPGIAPVAMQEGEYVARYIRNGIQHRPLSPFKYVDWGNLAVIGKHQAVVDMGWLKLSGFMAWFVWLFIHVFYLLEFDNKLIVMIQWAWSYFTESKGARLITTPGKDPEIRLEDDHETVIYQASLQQDLQKVASEVAIVNSQKGSEDNVSNLSST
ncbi:MAG TPA: FAD-dependent oxidoreductase [Cyanothece sp. UBA12306]|nr:FAD-dependent oxidoreductase [Cyanothece sp. UBA12306]